MARTPHRLRRRTHPFSILTLAIILGALGLCEIFPEPIAYADAAPYIPVGAAKTKKAVVAFPELRRKTTVEEEWAKVISNTVKSDLEFMNQYKLLEPAAFVEDAAQAGVAPQSFKYSDWTSIGAEFLIKGSVSLDPQRILTLEIHLYDTFGGKEILGKRYTALTQEAKAIGHSFANDMVQTLTGLPGIFQTKIAMSCDKTGKKEIYVMNFDGSDVKQVTHHHSLAFGPAWKPDGTRLAYSLFTRHKNNIKNIDLYEFDFSNNTVQLLSNRKGVNSGPAYSPDGKKMAVTLSYLGNPDLFLLDLQTHNATRLTKSMGFDVDPSWSNDGKELAFVSSRAGAPMIFSMKADGSKVTRLTYAGKYNATPTWSPQNNKIAFAGWIDKSFDIFTMNPDGSTIERLTKNQGNNEDPFFSPDGNFVVHSSNRTGQKNIYVMNNDGSYVKRLSYGLGNCVSPKWSLPPTSPSKGSSPGESDSAATKSKGN